MPIKPELRGFYLIDWAVAGSSGGESDSDDQRDAVHVSPVAKEFGGLKFDQITADPL